MTNRVAVISAVGAIAFMASAGMAGAYTVSGSSAPSSANFNISLPAVSAGTFTVDWSSFLNNLPVQPFLNSLQSAGSAAVQSIQNTQATVPTNINIANGQGIVNQIDDWTQRNLGFRLSALLTAFFGIVSWVLSLAKDIIDWLLKFVNGK